MIKTTDNKMIYKYEFISKLRGRAEADDDVFGQGYQHDSLELSSRDMANMYDNHYELEEWADFVREDLAEVFTEHYIIDYKLLKCEFGNLELKDGHLFHATKVETDRELKEYEIDELKGFISGQLSDGWGESAEQREFMEAQIEKSVPYWDEYSLEFDSEEYQITVEFYCIPSEYRVEDYRFVGTEEKESKISGLIAHLSVELTEGKVKNTDVYCMNGWDDFVRFCQVNNETHNMIPFVDCADCRDLAPGGKIFLRAIDDDFSDSPLFYENKAGGITVERSGGQDSYETLKECLIKLMAYDF